MVWHHKRSGCPSAEFVYAGRPEWLCKGLKQVKEDVETKYGPDWRKVIPVIATNLSGQEMVSWFSIPLSKESILIIGFHFRC
jgi:hypothetical protein